MWVDNLDIVVDIDISACWIGRKLVVGGESGWDGMFVD